jgi:predicted fused transcriptional regulator/phosphomethylpyrimidine kinase/predicted transcriptional regulator
MRLPCEYAVREYLPHVRARIVKRLVEGSGWSVYEAAKALKISATAAAKYKRISVRRPGMVPDAVERLAAELASRIAGGDLEAREFIEAVCSLCARARLQGDLCRLHIADSPELAGCRACAEVYAGAVSATSERRGLLKELEKALAILSSSRAFADLVPEVRTNIAAAARDARDLSDIAAFPGRLTVVRGRVVSLGPPEFGASRHMASVLLAARRVDERVGAVTCLKYTRAVERAIERLGLDSVEVDRSKFASVEDFIASLPKMPSVVVDPGGPGIEPVAYVFGSSAVSVAEVAVRIAEEALSAAAL